MSVARITELFSEIDTMAFGPEERARVDEAIALAVELGDEELEYRARIRLTASANQLGDTEALLSSFAWCLAKHDADPVRFPDDVVEGGAGLMWQFKWIATTLASSPIFGTDDISGALADMESHYRDAGIGQSGVLTSQFATAWRLGQLDRAEELRAQLAVTPRDDYSHCDACVRSDASGFLTETGRDAEAIVLFDELIEGGYSCGDEPEAALSRALLPYLRAGRLDDARAAHFRSYNLARDNADNLSIIANHFIFCAVTGNEARGLAMLERHLSWFVHDQLNADGQFSGLVAAGVLLDAVTAAGFGEQVVRGAESNELTALFGEHDGTWTAEELATATWAAARRIGDQFDERAGNNYRATRIQKAKNLANENYPLSLTSETLAAPTPADAEPTDAAGWLLRAEELTAIGWLPTALPAARKAAELATGTERTAALSTLVAGLVATGDLAAAEAALAERIPALREHGNEAQASLEELLGLSLFGRGEQDDFDKLSVAVGVSEELAPAQIADIELSLLSVLLRGEEPDLEAVTKLAASALVHAEAGEMPLLRAHALRYLSDLAATAGDTDRALAHLDDLLGATSNRGVLAHAHALRARILGSGGQFAAGAASADAAAECANAIDAAGPLHDTTILAGRLYDEAEQFTDAAGRFRLGIRYAERLEIETVGARYALGRALVRGGESAEAIELLLSLFEEETAAQAAPGSRGETLFWLGHGFADSGEPGSAVGTWETATELYLESGDTQSAARTLADSASVHAQHGDHETAATLLENAVTHARATPDDLNLLVRVLHQSGRAHAEAGNAAGLEALDEVLALAAEHNADWLHADVTDSKARSLASLGKPKESVALALTAADEYRAAGDPVAGANCERFVANVLAGEGRHDEAVAVLQSVMEQAADHERLRQITAFDLAESLDKLGRTAEAAAARALAEGA
ncbi:Tetratricopeptide repeat protein [Salinibacterium sp. NYA9b]